MTVESNENCDRSFAKCYILLPASKSLEKSSSKRTPTQSYTQCNSMNTNHPFMQSRPNIMRNFYQCRLYDIVPKHHPNLIISKCLSVERSVIWILKTLAVTVKNYGKHLFITKTPAVSCSKFVLCSSPSFLDFEEKVQLCLENASSAIL